MAIHNKSHNNHALRSINKQRKDKTGKYAKSSDFVVPEKVTISIQTKDCLDYLRQLPDESVQLICIDPPYNLEIEAWDAYPDYIAWAKEWLAEAYRVLKKSGSMVIFGGIQFRDIKSGDIIEIIHYVRHNTKFKLINTLVWYYKNGMSAHRYFASRHEEIIWLAKTNDYYFDLDSVRVPYSEEDLALALKDKRLNPENTKKGKNPTNVWQIGRLNGNSSERVGHPTQKPVEIIDKFVKALSYPGSVVLDFFAGSGTVGRACILEGRHCLMCDSDPRTVEFFNLHLEKMRDLGQATDFDEINDIDGFFESVASKTVELDTTERGIQ